MRLPADPVKLRLLIAAIMVAAVGAHLAKPEAVQQYWGRALASPAPGSPQLNLSPQIRITPRPAFSFTSLTITSGDIRALTGGRSVDDPGIHVVWLVNDSEVSEGRVLDSSYFRVGDRVQLHIVEEVPEGFDRVLLKDAMTIQNATPVIRQLLVVRSPRQPHLARSEIKCSDPDGNIIKVTYDWYLDGKQVLGADGPNFDLTGVKRGQLVSVTAIATDGIARTRPFMSDALHYENTPPRIMVASAARMQELSDGTWTVTCPLRVEDADGDSWKLHLTGNTSGIHWTGSELVWEGGIPGQSREITVEVEDESGETVARDISLRI